MKKNIHVLLACLVITIQWNSSLFAIKHPSLTATLTEAKRRAAQEREDKAKGGIPIPQTNKAALARNKRSQVVLEFNPTNLADDSDDDLPFPMSKPRADIPRERSKSRSRSSSRRSSFDSADDVAVTALTLGRDEPTRAMRDQMTLPQPPRVAVAAPAPAPAPRDRAVVPAPQPTATAPVGKFMPKPRTTSSDSSSSSSSDSSSSSSSNSNSSSSSSRRKSRHSSLDFDIFGNDLSKI